MLRTDAKRKGWNARRPFLEVAPDPAASPNRTVMRYYVMVMQSITIRFPDEVAAIARAESETQGESINQFVVEAVADAIARRRARRALARMEKRRDSMTAAGRVAAPSEPMIRQLREGVGRRD